MSEDLGLENGLKYVRLVLFVLWPYTDRIAVTCAFDIFYTLCAGAIAG
jgi:hypothetical protein